MIYILINNFTKSTATANRFLAECRGLKELGVNFKIVLTSAGDLYPNIDESIYGEVICLWPKLHFNNNTINKFVRKFYNEVYCPQDFKKNHKM